jgi:predicted ATPase
LLSSVYEHQKRLKINRHLKVAAGKYAAIGIEALPGDKWTDHYEMTLDLYSTAAEVEGFLGNVDRLETCYKEVIDQKDRPLFDTLRVHHAVISYTSGALGRPINAIDPISHLLAQFGLRFRKGKVARLVSTMSGFHKAKRKMLSLELEHISNLPMMQDPVHLKMMHLLDQLFIASYRSASDLMALTIFERIKLTLEHGLCEYSAHAFACLALVFRDDPALASKTGRFARLIMTIIDCKSVHAKAEVWLNALVLLLQATTHHKNDASISECI